MKGKVGIIANPQSGKDIRRLTSKASVFDNEEKVNIIERILSVFNFFNIEEIYYMEDAYGIVKKAASRIKASNLKIIPIEMNYTFDEVDSTNASKIMQNIVDIILVLGGDGTNRAVVKGLNMEDPVPLAPISTGTNNVFPEMIEGTTVALAIISYLTSIEKGGNLRREKLLNIKFNNNSDIALIDFAISKEQFIGSKAIWNEKSIIAVFVTRAEVTSIGFSSLVAFKNPIHRDDPFGGYVILGEGEEVIFPIAPGKLAKTSIKEKGIIKENNPIKMFVERGTIVLDGERKIELFKDTEVEISLLLNGPKVLNFRKAIAEGIKNGIFSNKQS
ncbi:MAG: diacylglycerol kinase family protein [Caldisericum sp.]